MKAIKITENIYWVGAIDWNMRNFHGYLTQRGTTYNAFLVIDEKITLVDTVKSEMSDEMMARISSVIDPSSIDMVICNHVEMDHSGAMTTVLNAAPNAEVVCSSKAKDGLLAHYGKDWNFTIVKTGDILSTGKLNFEFIMTPMVHWPDNMVCYIQEEKLLFSNDSFGQHLATSARFDDEYPLDIIMEGARKYYANIVLPYSKQVCKVLDVIENLELRTICTSHGIIWRKNIPEIIAEYRKWASNKTENKTIVVYDSMWKSTEKIAKAICEVFEEGGYQTSLFNLQHNHMSDIMTDMIDTEYLCVGSPTLNGDMMPSVAAFLTYLRGLAPKGRKAVVFGSYGWAKQNIKNMETYLTSFDIKAVYAVNYVPGHEKLQEIKEDLMQKITSDY